MKFRSENLLENGNKNWWNLPCVELLLSLTRIHSFRKNSLLHLAFIVKRQGRRLTAKSGSDQPKTSTNFLAYTLRNIIPHFTHQCVIGSWRRMESREGVVGRWVLSLSNLGLPSLHGDLLYSSPGAPSSAPFWTVQGMILTVSGRHFSRLTYKFYGAWWLRVASWRCFSGFMV